MTKVFVVNQKRGIDQRIIALFSLAKGVRKSNEAGLLVKSVRRSTFNSVTRIKPFIIGPFCLSTGEAIAHSATIFPPALKKSAVLL